ncbi:MAG: hypothetical protein HQ527_08505 [Cyanobacteria bacterium]|nr:hypothetical protein [Cyanobacteria bacterium bin.51]
MVESSSFPTPDAPGEQPAAAVSDAAVSEPVAEPTPPAAEERPEPVVAVPSADPVELPPAPAEPAPVLAATLEAPAMAPEPGGEWDLLVAKVKEWIGSGEPQKTFKRYSGPLKAAGLLLGVVVLLRLYGALLGAIEGLPLVPGLLELVGVIWLTGFSWNNLVRRSDRQRWLDSLQQRWSSFRGKS